MNNKFKNDISFNNDFIKIISLYDKSLYDKSFNYTSNDLINDIKESAKKNIKDENRYNRIINILDTYPNNIGYDDVIKLLGEISVL